MSYNPHQIKPAKGIADLVEEIRIESGTKANIVRTDKEKRTIYANGGDYADMIVLRSEAKKHDWKVEPIL